MSERRDRNSNIGSSSSALRRMPTTYEDELSHHSSDAGSLSTVSSLLTGAAAGSTAKTVIAPLDRVKIIYQVTRTRQFSFTSAYQELRRIVRTEGLMALWRGNSATMLRVVPYSAIQYSSFEQYKHFCITNIHSVNGDLSTISRFCVGAMAGATSVTFTYPFDLLRARLAMQRSRGRRIGSLVGLAREMVAADGPRSLFMGLRVTLIGIIPYAGFSFGTFESLKSAWLEKHDGLERLPAPYRMLFGAVSGLFAQTISYPLDTVRRRLQVEGSVCDSTGRQCVGLWNSLLTIGSEEGIRRGLFKGLAMNFVKGPIAVGISFTVFDSMKSRILSQSES